MWPSDPHQKLLGKWYMVGLTEGLEALSLAPFTRVNRWDANQHVRPFLKQVKEEIVSPKVHAYNNMYGRNCDSAVFVTDLFHSHIWVARRPLQ